MTALAPLVVAVPLLVAALLLVANTAFPRRILTDTVATATAAAVTAGCALLVVASAHQPVVAWLGGWQPRNGLAVGIALAVDPIGAGIATLAALLTTAALLFSWRYFEAVGTLYHVLMLTFLAGMVGFSLTGDLFNLFAFFELMSVAAYALTAYKVEEEGPLQGSLNFAVTNTIGAFLVLIGIALLYARTGSLNMAQVGQALAGAPVDALVVTAFVLISVGLFVKAALVPFHFWLPDAHAVAPTPFCIVLSGVMVELGLYAWVRIYWTVFAGAFGANVYVSEVAIWAGVTTALLGAVLCFSQFQLKRLLAYSTMSHSGLMLLGVGLLLPSGLAGAGLYVLAHGAIKGALFICVGILLHRHETVDETVLRARGIQEPVTGFVFALAGLALAGMPPFGTALGKQLMEESASHAGLGWLTAVFVLASAVTAGAVLRAAGRVFVGWGADEEPATPEAEGPETAGEHERTPFVMIAPAVLLVALALALGLASPIAHGTELASEWFVDREAYAATVLRGEVRPMPKHPSAAGLNLKGAVVGLIATAGAIAAGLVGLFHHSAPDGLRRRTSELGMPPLRLLRRLHSGHIGDYVAWLSAGVAAFGALFVLALL
ncbi:MAG: NADH-quinone oxidoreductase subunit D [Actinomycetota bacterium]|nr:NADH-quinone oxidoreductase subunit D [Actinomycetota bacterium]